MQNSNFISNWLIQTVSIVCWRDLFHQYSLINCNIYTISITDDGKITESEVKDILKHSVEESRYIFDDNEVEEMAKLVMERADLQKDGYLTYDEFKALFDYYQIGDQIGESLESWLLAKPDAYNHRNRNRRTGKMSLAYIRNNSSSLIFIIFICLVTLLLSAERFWEYQHRGWAVMFARAAGKSSHVEYIYRAILNSNFLNFISFLSRAKLEFFLRTHFTSCAQTEYQFLRTYGFSAALLDKNLYYHKVLGYLIFIFSLIHTIGHAIQSNMPGLISLFRQLLMQSSFTVSLFDSLLMTRKGRWISFLCPLSSHWIENGRWHSSTHWLDCLVCFVYHHLLISPHGSEKRSFRGKKLPLYETFISTKYDFFSIL